jgi:hypothetical protein
VRICEEKVSEKVAATEPTSLTWRKSTFSSSGGCVEVAYDGPFILVRDTKDRGGPWLRFNAVEWTAFAAGVGAGEFPPPDA